MSELTACTECGFTTKSAQEFAAHIEQHEEDHHRSSSGELSHTQTIEWTEESNSSGESNSPSPARTPTRNQATVIKPEPQEETFSPPKLESVIHLTPATVGKSNKVAHVCPHCNFKTFMSQHMKSHLEAHERHQGQMYQCDICQMQFSQKANMHRHRMRHSGVKPYECRFCKKRFFRKDQMQEHSMTHIKTGMDFDCPVAECPQQFSQHSSLRTHLEEMHNISSDQPASCKRCNLMFQNSRRLLLHYQTRHDESSSSDASSRKSSHSLSSAKRKRVTPPTSIPLISSKSITDQLQQMVQNEINAQQIPAEIQKTNVPEIEQTPTPTFPISNEDLLMLCLSGNAAALQNAAAVAVSAASSLGSTSFLPQTQLAVPWPAIQQSSQSPTETATAAHSPSIESGSSAESNEDSAKEGKLVSSYDHQLKMYQ
ncbi:hypothetical protein WR25_19398 isoform D [Diploscapter pachys]|uniref:C2H2-type domain-containing protein n=1 Tax=Diploscapter pachys TaxID=2018661 RepID=A0A2A2K998_9BILA|nr:hypothetical protein WR25_19398 isoform D [Diploscapter pachys]